MFLNNWPPFQCLVFPMYRGVCETPVNELYKIWSFKYGVNELVV